MYRSIEILEFMITLIFTSYEAYTKNNDNKIEERKHLLQKEKEIIKISIEKYSDKSKNPLKAIFYFIKLKGAIRRQKILEYSFEKEVIRPFKKLEEKIQRIKEEIYLKENNFESVVENRSERYIRKIKKQNQK